MTVSADDSTQTPDPLRDALGPLVASGHRLVTDVSRAEWFGSAYVGALLGTLAVARRIPAVSSVLEALRRLEAGDGASVPVLPLVAPEKLNC